MDWIAKPFILPLHLFHYEKQYTISKTRTRLAAFAPHWRLLTSPIVEKKHVHFPTVNSNSREKCIEYIFHDCFQQSSEESIFHDCFQKSSEKCIGSPNPLFYRCNFVSLRKTIRFFKQLERNSPHLRDTGGS